MSSTMTYVKFDSATKYNSPFPCALRKSENRSTSIYEFIFYWTETYLFPFNNDASSFSSEFSNSYCKQRGAQSREENVLLKLGPGLSKLQDKTRCK